MTWFDIMKGSYTSSHKTDWLDRRVWSDFWGVISSFINDKHDIARAVKSGLTIRIKSGMTEHPLDAMGRYYGGPNNWVGYDELKEEVKRFHRVGQAIREYKEMENYMNRLVGKYLTTKGNTDEFTEYRRDAQMFGSMASGIGPKQGTKTENQQLRDIFGDDIKIRGKSSPLSPARTFRHMTSDGARCGVMSDMNYALKLLKTQPKKSKENDFDNLMEHIKRKDNYYCDKMIKQLIDRVFNFNKMQHCPIKGGLGSGKTRDHAWIKDYVNKSHNLVPIKDLAKTSTNPKDYYEMFRKTHPNTMSRDKPFYKEMWRYGGHSQMFAFNRRCLRPFRTRLLLIWNFHLACTGAVTVEEFKEWVN